MVALRKRPAAVFLVLRRAAELVMASRVLATTPVKYLSINNPSTP